VKREKKLRLPRGIYDISPEMFEKYLWLFDIFRDTCNRFNFKIMEPATIEFFETLAMKSGPDISKEIYDFKDKAGRRLGLRFDLTVGLSRYVATHPELPKPIRLAAYSVQWRYDEPQFGRYRSFYAWDIEIFGGDEVFSAIETILFVNAFLRRVGLRRFEVLLSDRRFVENVIKYFSPKGDIFAIMRALDKWGKLKKDEIVSLIEKAGGENIDNIINLLFYCNEDEIMYLMDKFNAAKLKSLYQILVDEYKIGNVRIDPSIVRGLDYYDGIVFEVKDEVAKNLGAIVGGGNFSTLMKIFGSDLNAFGAAGGVERTLLALESEGVKIKKEDRPLIYIIPLDENYLPYSMKIADEIRSRYSVNVETPLLFKSLRKSLQYANKIDADYVIFIGKKEIASNKLKIKDLNKRKEYVLSLEELDSLFNFS
jgi:histidyl-tRNA synthetase